MDLADLLTAPVLGAPRMVCWLASKLIEEAERQLLDEGRVRAELMELQTRYDLGEVNEEEYDQQEKELLDRLDAARAVREGQREEEPNDG